MSLNECRLHVAVPVSPGGYDVMYGRAIVANLADFLAGLDARGRAIVISDDHVARIYGKSVLTGLQKAGVEALLWAMPAGEPAKTLETVHSAYSWLAGRRVERADTIVALGGGVVGDLAGFVAATYLRGLRLVQAPTTLVAQVDSAIGGKVGVDLIEGKNLVGAFCNPAMVIADIDLLDSLPEREWIAGLAEVIKHGIIRDPSLSTLLCQQRDAILCRDRDVVARDVVSGMVKQAGAVKVAVVTEDPLERGLRRILNYGHTVGHAIEREAGYGRVLHGEAVAWGMATAARIALAVGTCDKAFVAWQDDLLRSYGLLRPLPPLRRDAVVNATRLDKKSAAGRIHWVLPRGVGDVIVTADVPEAYVEQAVGWLTTAADGEE